jgi:hypothetical protein
MEPSKRLGVQLPTSRWRALTLMAEAEHRTPQQQLASLLERWWSHDPAMTHWCEAALTRWPEMREPEWWRRKESE